jgi:hypothetical protein
MPFRTKWDFYLNILSTNRGLIDVLISVRMLRKTSFVTESQNFLWSINPWRWCTASISFSHISKYLKNAKYLISSWNLLHYVYIGSGQQCRLHIELNMRGKCWLKFCVCWNQRYARHYYNRCMINFINKYNNRILLFIRQFSLIPHRTNMFIHNDAVILGLMLHRRKISFLRFADEVPPYLKV